MIVDSSAIVAILSHEPEAIALMKVISQDINCMMSVANHVEASMVLSNSKEQFASLDPMIQKLAIEIVPVSLAQGTLAIEAFHKYGKGRHPARLNYGDCFAYALAKERDEPLLFKGNDFSQTDIERVAY